MAAMRIGEILVKAGLLTEPQLRVALAQIKSHGGRLGEHLIQVGVLTEVQLARTLAKQGGVAYTDVSALPPASVTNLLKAEDALRLQALPISLERGQLSVAFGDVDEDVRNEVARLIGRPIVPLIAPQVALRRAVERVYSAVDLKDEGTSEFQLFDSRGLGKVVKVAGESDDDLPEVSVMELSAVTGAELPSVDYDEPEPAPRAPMPSRPTPRAPPPAAPRPALSKPPIAAWASDAAGEEAMRMLWSLADLLVEKGFVSRAELMAKLRK